MNTNLYVTKLLLMKEKLTERLNKFLNLMFSDKFSTYLFWLLIIGVVVAMYRLNFHTVLIVDDYNYSFAYGGERVSSIKDIIITQYHHYFNWGGRVVAHFLAQLFLMLDKSIFNVFNTLAYISLVLAIYFNAVGRLKFYPTLIIVINFMLFMFMPAFGQVFLWVTGACNYLWCPLLVMLYLLPYRFQAVRNYALIENKILCVVIFLLGIVAGWTNENMGITLFVMLGLFMLLYWYEHKKVYLWCMCGLAGVLIGAVMLIIAPGNFVRLDVIAQMSSSGTAVHVWRNFGNITALLFKPKILLWPMSAMLILLMFRKVNSNLRIFSIYLTGMLISMYAMVGSPFFADRAKAGTMILAIIAVSSLYDKLDFASVKVQSVVTVLAIALSGTLGSEYKTASRDIKAYEIRDNQKVNYVLEEKSKGNLDITIPKNYPATKYCASWGLEDISTDVKHWTNTGFARYFGVKTVKVE